MISSSVTLRSSWLIPRLDLAIIAQPWRGLGGEVEAPLITSEFASVSLPGIPGLLRKPLSIATVNPPLTHTLKLWILILSKLRSLNEDLRARKLQYFWEIWILCCQRISMIRDYIVLNRKIMCNHNSSTKLYACLRTVGNLVAIPF